MNRTSYTWAARGDINAFFGLMLDNVAGLVLTVTMLSSIFSFPIEFALRTMIPGTAIGVLMGDLLFFGLAFRLAKREGRSDVTAMPLGLDTPSTIGMVLFVLGPAFAGKSAELARAAGQQLDSLRASVADGTADAAAQQLFQEIELGAATHAWHIGMGALLITGLIKAALALGAGWLRRIFPRAGLLGSLAAIALVLIAFNPLPKIADDPIVGFASLVIVLATLVARGQLPFKIPGALGAVVVGCGLWYLLRLIDTGLGTQFAHTPEASELVLLPTEWLSAFSMAWLTSLPEALGYLPYIIPFAITTVIGGIDCTESAASAGDAYDTRQVIGIESLATIMAGLCGGVIQTTPYIGHPAYKAMGGRAAYTLATALFVGGAGVIGYFSVLFRILPEAAVLPILIFIGIEITAQSFQATPRRHYAALAVACLPALAKLIMIVLGQYVPPETMSSNPGILHLRVLAGGFIITSLMWASAMAYITDRRMFGAAGYFVGGGLMVLFGIMHSPMDGDKMFWPWNIGVTLDATGSAVVDPQLRQLVFEFALAYFVMAAIVGLLGAIMKPQVIDSDEEYDRLSGH